MKFSGICLITENVSTLANFYARVFCSEAVGDDQHAELCFAGVNLAIFSRSGMEQMAEGCMRGSGHGGFTTGFEVENVDAEYERLKALNVQFVKPPTTHPWGCRSLWFRDPDGNIIDFMTMGVVTG